MDRLPVVDFSCLSVDKDECSLDHDAMDNLVEEIMDAFTSIGFVNLINHGIPNDQLRNIRQLSEEFFDQPVSVKDKYRKSKMHGYKGMHKDAFKTGSSSDIKETFDVCPSDAQAWPDEVVGFKDQFLGLYTSIEKLARRILIAVARGLDVKPDVLLDTVGNENRNSYTSLSVLKYPPIPQGVEPPHVRHKAHTDYGALTIIFQDNVGGLEVKTPSGEWIDATPVPGAALVNIDDLMQRMSSDRLKSTLHRVLLPIEEFRKKSTRYSTVFFVHPENNAVISCLDGNDKYEPIRAEDYTEESNILLKQIRDT